MRVGRRSAPGKRDLGRLLTWIWLGLVIAVLTLWITEPTRFSEAAIARVISDWGAWAFAGFALISVVRGALLIPSTPVVLAGGALFPRAPLFVFLVSMAGIVFSATLLYRFPGFAGYDARLVVKYPAQLERLRVHLVKPRAMWFVALWSFFPAVPTDLICYVAGLVRMPYQRMLLGLIIGEVPLVLAYVFLGTGLGALLS